MDIDYTHWKNQPDAVGPIESVLVRYVAGEMDSTAAAGILGLEPKDVRARATALLVEHYEMDELAELLELPPTKRLRLAEEIVEGTLHGRKGRKLAPVIGLVPKKPPPEGDDPGPKSA